MTREELFKKNQQLSTEFNYIFWNIPKLKRRFLIMP